MVQDVKKAYFFAPATRRVFVALPPEDTGPGEEGMCALLQKSLYGTRDAAMIWANAYTEVLVEKLGFEKGASSPCSFYNKAKQLRLAVHGDDFITEGVRSSLEWLDLKMKEHFELKKEILGPKSSNGCVQEVRVLNRVLRWQHDGISWEPDPRHAELVVQTLELQGSRSTTTPGNKDAERKQRPNDPHRQSENKDEGIYELVDDDDGNGPELQLRTAQDSDVFWVMSVDGWTRTAQGGWEKTFLGATSVGRPPIGTMRRRVTRDTDNGGLMEDLVISALTPEKRVNKSLAKPRNVSVEVYLDETEVDDQKWLDSPMEPKEQSLYRAVTARINFLAMDRADLQFASKECSRHMSAPLNKHWVALKRIGRYLVGCPRVVTLYKWQDMPSTLSVYSDSNWAGCLATRKSTSGAAYLHGQHLLKTYSRTHSNIALSSAEAELYAAVAATSEALGMKTMMRDYGVDIDPYLYVDASAAIGIAERKGLGKLRHLDTQSLWIQDAVRQRRVVLEKVAGVSNPADLMTKHLDSPVLLRLMGMMGMMVAQGRAESAPQLVRKAMESSISTLSAPTTSLSPKSNATSTTPASTPITARKVTFSAAVVSQSSRPMTSSPASRLTKITVYGEAVPRTQSTPATILTASTTSTKSTAHKLQGR